MNGSIEALTPQNYGKCGNIWDMSEKPDWASRWYDELVTGNRIIFVYVEDGQYLGEGALVRRMEDPDYTIENRRIYLSRMIVKPGYCGRGIGGRLLDFLIDYAAELGYSEISLGVDAANVAARRLYEKKRALPTRFLREATQTVPM